MASTVDTAQTGGRPGALRTAAVDGRDGLRPAQRWQRLPAPDSAAIQALYLTQKLNTVQIGKQLGISRERVERSLRESGTPRHDGRKPCPVSQEELRRMHRATPAVSGRNGLAQQLGAAKATVNRWLAEAGLLEPTGSLDVDELRRLYVDEKLPTREVARRMGCSLTGAKIAMERAGIPRRVSGAENYSEHRAAITEEKLREVYVDGGLSLKDAAASLGVGVNYLRKRLAEAGLAKRPGTHTPKTQYSRAELRQLAAQMYEAGASIRAVAAGLGVGYAAARTALHEAAVPIRRGGSPYTPEDVPPRRMIDDLYADPAIVACLHRHGVAVPEADEWSPAGPTQTLAPLPLSHDLLRELYDDIGLALLQITMLCGVGTTTVTTGMADAGITSRAMHAPSPWLVKTYGRCSTSRR